MCMHLHHALHFRGLGTLRFGSYISHDCIAVALGNHGDYEHALSACSLCNMLKRIL